MNVTQIQIVPVENGFTIQAVALDGVNRSRKLVATSLDDCRTTLHGLVDEFHVPVTKPAAAPANVAVVPLTPPPPQPPT